MNTYEICNMALTALGIPPITSFADNSETARHCARLFPIMRDRVLRDHYWSFAAAGSTLSASNEIPFDARFSFVCSLPGDLLRIIELQDDLPFRKIGNKIFTTFQNPKVIYIRKVQNSEEFDTLFCEALQYLMASELAMIFTKDNGITQYLQSQYQNALSRARSIDSAENINAYHKSKMPADFIKSRFGVVR